MPPHRPPLGAISVAFAAGILLADHAGPFARAPAVWLGLALLLVVAFPRSRAVILLFVLVMGGARHACDGRDPVRLPPGVAAAPACMFRYAWLAAAAWAGVRYHESSVP